MNNEKNISIINEICSKLGVKPEDFEEEKLEDINASIYTPKNNQRGIGGFIIADDGSYLICGSIHPIDYYIEEFKNGKRDIM